MIFYACVLGAGFPNHLLILKGLVNPLTLHPGKRECIFQPLIFRGRVSFQGSITFRFPFPPTPHHQGVRCPPLPVKILLAGQPSPLRQRAAPLALAATLGHGAAAAAAAAGGGGVEVALGGGGENSVAGRHDDWWFFETWYW